MLEVSHVSSFSPPCFFPWQAHRCRDLEEKNLPFRLFEMAPGSHFDLLNTFSGAGIEVG